jgi:ATP/maltotriose-dependent transcriptional regulator MalT
MFPLSTRAKLEYEVGDFVQGDAYLEQLLDTEDVAARGLIEYAYFSFAISAIACITGAMNHFDSARKAAETTMTSPYAIPFVTIFARVGLATMAAQRGDSQTAVEQYAALETERGPVLYAGWICLDRLLGLLAHTIGYLDRAIKHFEDALAFCRRAGYRPELAWTCYDYANLLHQRGQRLKALSLLEEALAISTALGMKPLMEKVIALKEQVEAQQAKAPQYPSGLTEREVEVLRLVASGSSNAEIANKLVLSVRTVERHISNIYSKTKTHGRAEATAFAFTHGLIPSNRTT